MDNAGQGGVLVRKAIHKQNLKGNAVADQDKKQMQICFSIASKASTMTQHITESYNAIPNLDEKTLEQADRVPALKKTPTGLASQLKIMEELGKSVRETPISIMESESLTFLNPGGPHRDAT